MEHWIFLMFFIRVHCQRAENYFIHKEEVNFDDALAKCQDSRGFLTDMADEEEVYSGILPAVSHTLHSNGNFSFWIGLKRSGCFDKDQPLFGFIWTVNSSRLSRVARWRYQPRKTCTSKSCGSLSVEYSGSNIADWGFEEKKCNTNQKFICKKLTKVNSKWPDKKVTLMQPSVQPSVVKGTQDSSRLIPSARPPVKSIASSTASSTALRTVTTTTESSELQHSKLSVFMPVLIALSVLVLLVVIILVVVKCCFVRRMKKFQGQKGPKSKESIDLKDRDSEEQSNEKDSLRS